MPSEFMVEINIDVAIPDFMDADVPLKQIAGKIVSDCQENIRLQRSPDGTAFQALKEKTIRSKKNKGYSFPSRALYAKGIMYNAIHAYRLGKNNFAVGVIARGKPSRDLVGLIHQEIGVPSKTGLVARPFIGISQKVFDWANARLQRWVNERVQKQSRKQIKLKY